MLNDGSAFSVSHSSATFCLHPLPYSRTAVPAAVAAAPAAPPPSPLLLLQLQVTW